MNLSEKINGMTHELFRRRVMRYYCREMATIKREHPDSLRACSESVLTRHLALWRQLDPRISDDWARLFYGITGVEDHRFVPSPIYYGIIERCLNSCNSAFNGIEDKNLMSLYVPAESRARCILRYVQGCFFTDAYEPISREQAEAVLSDYRMDVVGKVSEGSFGGHSVELFCDEGGRKIGERHDLTVDWIVENTVAYVVQERLHQEERVASFNPASINTCRLMTFRRPWDGATRVVASMLRLGCGKSLVDNISSGGASVGVLQDGALRSRGVDCSYGIVDSHPGSGKSFQGFSVPGFDKMCETAVSIARRVPRFNILGFDVIVRDDGRPCIIEVNATSLCAIEVQQSGPMFGEDTEQVVDWCLKNSKFDTFKHLRTWY